MKINNEFLVNTFFEMGNKEATSIKNDNNSSFSEIMEETLKGKTTINYSPQEVSNGDTFRKELENNNLFQGGGWAYVDKYGFSHVVSDYKTASVFKKPGTEVYSYNGKYGGGYALDEENDRLRLPIPEEKPFGNDRDELTGKKSEMADIKDIGEAVSYLKYLEIISGFQKIM